MSLLHKEEKNERKRKQENPSSLPSKKNTTVAHLPVRLSPIVLFFFRPLPGRLTFGSPLCASTVAAWVGVRFEVLSSTSLSSLALGGAPSAVVDVVVGGRGGRCGAVVAATVRASADRRSVCGAVERHVVARRGAARGTALP